MAANVNMFKHRAIDAFIANHFIISPATKPLEDKKVGAMKAKAKGKDSSAAAEAKAKPMAKAAALAAEAAPALPKANGRPMLLYKCKACQHEFRDTSNSKAILHKLLMQTTNVKQCSDPQVKISEIDELLKNDVEKAKGFSARLRAHIDMGRITNEQPSQKDVEDS